jgi:hypothetical protein
MSRQDQIRDNDAIQRDTISATILPGANVVVFHPRSGEWFMGFAEPNTSANQDHMKFCFKFESLAALNGFVEKINAARSEANLTLFD